MSFGDRAFGFCSNVRLRSHRLGDACASDTSLCRGNADGFGLAKKRTDKQPSAVRESGQDGIHETG
jgi:hypothetical protein